MIQKIGRACTEGNSPAKVEEETKRVDKELGEYMSCAKNHCRRSKSGVIPFSPKAALWIERIQVNRSLLQYHEGRIHNIGNLTRRPGK